MKQIVCFWLTNENKNKSFYFVFIYSTFGFLIFLNPSFCEFKYMHKLKHFYENDCRGSRTSIVKYQPRSPVPDLLHTTLLLLDIKLNPQPKGFGL